ncbi:unnamed protein product [Protopolystoma xenopodis]|uniref:Uncharacterized protein n=1 Tax=Protopolystoma xenopodis TaxID=117903 RepID=A0A448XKD6_9PLAT|nr:unnamed protein product [Protopolystoma xenopodis]
MVGYTNKHNDRRWDLLMAPILANNSMARLEDHLLQETIPTKNCRSDTWMTILSSDLRREIGPIFEIRLLQDCEEKLVKVLPEEIQSSVPPEKEDAVAESGEKALIFRPSFDEHHPSQVPSSQPNSTLFTQHFHSKCYKIVCSCGRCCVGVTESGKKTKMLAMEAGFDGRKL